MAWYDYWPMPWFHFGPVMMVLFIFFCVGMMILMMRGCGIRRHRSGRALDILKERYARGEIDQAEFEQRRRILES
jgi:putative membrane protein